MEHIKPEVVRRYHAGIQARLTRWEANPQAEAPALRATVREARAALKAWDDTGVYPSHEIRMLRDITTHVDARFEQAAQEKARGY